MRRFFVGKAIGAIILFVILLLIFWAEAAGAANEPSWVSIPPRNPNTVTDWYIHSFDINLTVNPDASLSTTETIVADAADLTGKHGIFVTIPTRTYLTSSTYLEQPVFNVQIMDENGQARPYTISKDSKNFTETYKIGSPSQTVTGLNTYVISFDTANAVRKTNDQAELYWDILGSFWQLDIDNFHATVSFPEGFDHTSQESNFYGGKEGGNTNTFARYAKYEWTALNVLEVTSITSPMRGIGLTVSVTAPIELFTGTLPDTKNDLSKSSWWGIWWMIIPLGVLWLMYKLWRKYGDDPTIPGGNTVAPEFDVPKDSSKQPFDPINMDIVYRNGTLSSAALSAAIIDLAVKGYITITKTVDQKIFGLKTTDYELAKTVKSPDSKTSPAETDLYQKLFASADKVSLNSLKDKFYTKVEAIKKSALAKLKAQKLLDTTGKSIQAVIWFLLVGSLIWVTMIYSSPGWNIHNYWFGSSLVATFIILVIFTIIMPRRTIEGQLALRQIKGFQMYLKVAEQHRQRFFEEHDLWERFLPYAILFGLTGKWAAILKDLAAADSSFATYHPIWWMGPSSPGQAQAFDVGDFATQLNSVSSAIGTSMTSSPSSSGTGGGGFSGGGGGGGGGGGW